MPAMVDASARVHKIIQLNEPIQYLNSNDLVKFVQNHIIPMLKPLPEAWPAGSAHALGYTFGEE
jgi:hypothetical protein